MGEQPPPERIARVTIPLSRGPILLPWASRAELLGQIRHLDSARPIVKAFEDVGTSQPVKLSAEQKGLLITVIEHWGSQARGGLTDGLPPGVFELRNALHDDLHDRRERGE